MDDLDKALESLRFQIKKEIIDNYFAERVYLEEEIQALDEEIQEYRTAYAQLRRKLCTFYQALGSEAAIVAAMRVLGLKETPAYPEFCALPLAERQRLLAACPAKGLTAWRRHRNRVLSLYEDLQRHNELLEAKHRKILINQRLLNEDIQKFNSAFDFGLIAAQVEAMDGGGEVISGGLMAGEREELSSRMRFKSRKLTEEELPPPLELPPLGRVQERLVQVLAQCYG
jgi:hypothetical protein